jgi:hypothetical protein
MNRPERTGEPLRVTSVTSITPREVDTSTRRPAFVASISYFNGAPPPESTTTSTRSPRMAVSVPPSTDTRPLSLCRRGSSDAVSPDLS